MLDRLPKWVEAGGGFLALAAGFVNAVALLGFNHQGVSHLSGISTLIGIESSTGSLRTVAFLFAILVSFMIGAAISGVLIGSRSLSLGPRYAVALFCEAVLLVGAMFLLETGSGIGHFLASAACGLQNAITSTFSGAIVRTTHVTGLFTDLGVALGLKLRGEAVARRRLGLYAVLIGGFVAGGALGALAFGAWSFQALASPAVLVALLGVLVFAFGSKR